MRNETPSEITLWLSFWGDIYHPFILCDRGDQIRCDRISAIRKRCEGCCARLVGLVSKAPNAIEGPSANFPTSPLFGEICDGSGRQIHGCSGGRVN